MIKKNSDPTYGAWANLLNRYRSKGTVTEEVCMQWLSSDSFLADMGERPSSAHQLVRLDKAQPFSKTNCAWIIPPPFVRKPAPSAYFTWVEMRQRCHNPNNPRYRSYGGRSITVCAEWESYERFIADMGPRPSPVHTLDRENNDKGYYKSNCRWVTMRVQMRNTRKNRWITLHGKTQCLTDWANEVGVHYTVIIARIKRGYSEHDAVYNPLLVKKHGRGARV